MTIQGDEAGPAGRRHDASPAQAAEQVSDDDDNNHEPRQHRDGQLPEALASLADQVGHGDPQETVLVVLPRDDQAQYNFFMSAEELISHHTLHCIKLLNSTYKRF